MKTVYPQQEAHTVLAEIKPSAIVQRLLLGVQWLYAREENQQGMVQQVSCNSEGTHTTYMSM
jgi:hypothetical protein